MLSNMEPALGFEPRTDGLQNRSSTAELSRRHDSGFHLRRPSGNGTFMRLSSGSAARTWIASSINMAYFFQKSNSFAFFSGSSSYPNFLSGADNVFSSSGMIGLTKDIVSSLTCTLGFLSRTLRL